MTLEEICRMFVTNGIELNIALNHMKDTVDFRARHSSFAVLHSIPLRTIDNIECDDIIRELAHAVVDKDYATGGIVTSTPKMSDTEGEMVFFIAPQFRLCSQCKIRPATTSTKLCPECEERFTKRLAEALKDYSENFGKEV